MPLCRVYRLAHRKIYIKRALVMSMSLLKLNHLENYLHIETIFWKMNPIQEIFDLEILFWAIYHNIFRCLCTTFKLLSMDRTNPGTKSKWPIRSDVNYTMSRKWFTMEINTNKLINELVYYFSWRFNSIVFEYVEYVGRSNRNGVVDITSPEWIGFSHRIIICFGDIENFGKSR